MKKLPLNVLYRLYKAEIGDTIDNTYIRLGGSWVATEFSLNDGFVGTTSIYHLAFKDLSDGLYYQTDYIAEPVLDRDSSPLIWYKEPFTDASRDTRSVLSSQYITRTINMIDYLETLQP
ncbi:hypothetical protein [Serratia fonticola]|uniref:hypothetical protein n=1 Tax=Serratia fonticola TaxID=47917 RepID=UPI001AE4F91A|nr:hypothetical protein [Serratia fonticola]MBP0996511.1 hypothetical protein [Serratia fonticola]MBP1002562.1 hypothetical protein [Serratia fonticola]MBP1012114.1 hypothetical protein [Serratia fonticola]